MSSTFLDLRTISFTLMLVTMFLSFILCVVWRRNKVYPGFGLWVIANFTVATGFFFLSLRGIISESFATIIGNVLIFGSFLLALEANRKFLGLGNYRFFTSGMLGVFTILIIYLTYTENTLTSRIILASLSITVVSIFNAFAYIRSFLQEDNFTHKLSAAIYILMGSVLIARTILTYEFSDSTGLETSDWVQPVFYLIFIIISITLTFKYIVLNNERLHQELEITQTNLEKLATTDFLTGIYNNRYFFEIGKKEIQRARRFNNSLAIIMIDIDHFKYFNDNFGHAAGDKVLIEIARICRKTLRNIDVLARLGGEEFAVILPSTNAANAETVAENLRAAVAAARLEFISEDIKITASFGISELTPEDKHIESILRRADTALYEAKRTGRNRVITTASHTVDFTKLAAA